MKKQKGFQEFNELDERGLSQWLVRLANEKGATMSPHDANYLISRIGTNQQSLASEIEKLSLNQATINRNVIDELTAAAPQSTIFQLLEAAFAGNSALALKLYAEQRALKVEPQQIIAMLAWQLHVLALVKTAGKKTPDEIARDARLSPYVVRKSASVARSLTLAQLKRMVKDLLEIDDRLKSESLNADDTLLYYLMTLANK